MRGASGREAARRPLRQPTVWFPKATVAIFVIPVFVHLALTELFWWEIHRLWETNVPRTSWLKWRRMGSPPSFEGTQRSGRHLGLLWSFWLSRAWERRQRCC